MNNNITEMKKRFLIIYHEEDNDGVCSAAMAKHYLVNELNIPKEDVLTYPATYAKLDKLVKNKFYIYGTESPSGITTNVLGNFTNVIMTDISFNDFSGIEKFYEKFGNDFVWIDHHAPIIQESIKNGLDDKIAGVRDTTRSAILNMYKYLYDPFDNDYFANKIPSILRYLSAWDSWSYEREGLDFEVCRIINLGVTKLGKLSLDWWYDNWQRIVGGGYADEAYKIGKMWSDDFDSHWARAMEKNAQGGFTVDGRPAILVFSDSATSSLCFEGVKDKYQNGICIKSSSDGNIIISLYNTDNQHDFHCGNYLKEHYNGGGHEGAAGGKMTFDEFVEHYKAKAF